MSEKINIKEEIEKGRVYGRLVFEVFGKPEENVNKAIHLLVEKFKEMNEYKVVVEKYFDAKEVEGMWTNMVEVEILFKDFASVMNMAIDFLPASIEIIEPTETVMQADDLNGLLNDLSVKMIAISNEYQKAVAENNIYKKKLNTIISIDILRSLKDAPKSIEDMSNDLRIEKEDLKPFVDDLLKGNKIEEKDDKYQLAV